MQWLGTPGHFINTASGEIDSYVNPDYAHATYDDDNNPSTAEVPWPETFKRYATANRRIDYGVGDILRLLKDLQIDSTTLIVYTSDNGPSIETYLRKEKWEEKHLPTFFKSYGPFDGIKRDDWEGGVRMATIAAWPGHLPAGKVDTTPSISYDWAPTFLEAAGSPAPERMDGVSLLPSLTGRGSQRTSLVYMEYYHAGKTPAFKDFTAAHRGRARKQMQSLRLGDYMGVRYDVQSAGDSFEIYDVVKDPQERYNLAGRKRQVTIPEKGPFGGTKKIALNMGQLQAYMQARVLQVRRPNPSAPRPYDSAFVPAVHARVTRGIEWRIYTGSFPWIPQTATLRIAREGTVSGPGAMVTKDSLNGLVYFQGYIRVPADGYYTFYLASATHAFLRIHAAQLIDEDFGYVKGAERKASIRLKAGLHPFRLYEQLRRGVKPFVKMEWSGPGIPKGPLPDKALYREE